MHKKKLTPKKSPDSIGRKPGKYKWFEIQDSTAYWNIFLEEGIVYPDINQEPNFAINEINEFNTLNYITLLILRWSILIAFLTAYYESLRIGMGDIIVFTVIGLIGLMYVKEKR